MRKIITLPAFIVLSFFFYQPVNAQTLRRVGFTSSTTPINGVDYTTLQAAHDAANPGDTIQLYPLANGGTGASYFATFNKRLVLIGPGYMYNTYNISSPSEIPNAGLQALQGGIVSTSINLATGSSGSAFSGINGISIGLSNGITDTINNISITRCRNLSVSLSQNTNTLNNWLISQCFDFRIIQQDLSNSSFSGNRTLTNWRIENCIGYNTNSAISLSTSPLGISSIQVLNCSFWGYSGSLGTLYLANQSAVVQNCIFNVTNANSGLSNTVFINNITGSAQLNNPMFTNPGSSGNVFGVNIDGTGNAVFQGYPNNQSGNTVLYSPDARFKLSGAANPAKGAGIIPGTATPTDCGAYGGTNPYKDSGIPAVPAFYRFNSPSGTASGTSYPVTFSVRSNN